MVDKYTYRVMWHEPDREYVGLCSEFPTLSWLGRTPEKALAGIRRVVREVIDDMKSQGEDIPSPFAEKKFSGKFVVRVPPDVHRHVAISASEAGVSLNQFVATRLAKVSE